MEMKMKTKKIISLAMFATGMFFAPPALADAFIYDQNTRAVIAHVDSCTYKFVDADDDVIWTVTNSNGKITTFSGSGGLICDGDDVSEGNIANPNSHGDKVLPKDIKHQKYQIRESKNLKVQKIK